MKFYKSILHSVVLSSILGLSIIGLSYANASADSQDNGQSHPSAEINDNRLTLEKVPALNFSDNNDNSEESGNSRLGLNNSSSDNNELQVNDYRNSDLSKNNPWTLSVKLDNFTSTTGHSGDSDNNWLINFNTNHLNDSLKTFYMNNNKNSSYNDPNNINIYSNGDNVPIINGNYGVTKANYNNGEDISLDIPNVAPAVYNSTVTWSLNTAVKGNDANRD